jgi:hypothetical protein
LARGHGRHSRQSQRGLGPGWVRSNDPGRPTSGAVRCRPPLPAHPGRFASEASVGLRSDEPPNACPGASNGRPKGKVAPAPENGAWGLLVTICDWRRLTACSSTCCGVALRKMKTTRRNALLLVSGLDPFDPAPWLALHERMRGRRPRALRARARPCCEQTILADVSTLYWRRTFGAGPMRPEFCLGQESIRGRSTLLLPQAL